MNFSHFSPASQNNAENSAMWHVLRRAALLAISLALAIPVRTHSQSAMSGFNPDAELAKITSMASGFQKLQRFYYLGELTANAGRSDVAREAYRRALETYGTLSGNPRKLAVPYAAQSALSLAGMTHLAYRDAPLRWESFQVDSATRWDLLSHTRDEYSRVAAVGYARSTFEALFFRAYALQEWESAQFDDTAEHLPGTDPLKRAIRQVNLSRQLVDQAVSEYDRILFLADSLGLTGGTGDRNVGAWTSAAAQERTTNLQQRDTLAMREEALQALFAERQSALWMARAEPFLWRKSEDVAYQDAGIADPFFDFVLETKLVNDIYRPFLFGPNGFITVHGNAIRRAQTVRSTEWLDQRMAWRHEQEWRDSEIGRKLALDGIKQLERVPAMIDSAISILKTSVDSLPDEWRNTLGHPGPIPPAVAMPAIPDFGGIDPRFLSPEDQREKVDEFQQYTAQMESIGRDVEAYKAAVREFSNSVERLTTAPPPLSVRTFEKSRRAVGAARVLLLDTLSTAVIQQCERALERSRMGVVWMQPDEQSRSPLQTIRQFGESAALDLGGIAERCRAQASRYRQEAGSLHQRPPAKDLLDTASALERFADLMDLKARDFAPNGG
jgi:hypothetical protein